jgi:ergothioneine biosynthesis protein EgtB
MERDDLLRRYDETRGLTLALCRPLRPEDYRVQSMPDVSPPWWNLGHTSWFFAKNILEPWGLYTPEDARFEYPLNSYYEALGPRLARDRRGLQTRPTTDEILAFRSRVDERMRSLLREAPESDLERLGFLLTTGINHEQQHQELLVTEIKHILGSNPPELREAYQPADKRSPSAPRADKHFLDCPGGLQRFGNLEGGWCWDNELPIHQAYVAPFAVAPRSVTNREYLEFMAGGGYRDPLLWLSNGWSAVRTQGWESPMYWERHGEEWKTWTLSGLQPLDPEEPVCHVSFYEADAYARWRAARDQDPELRLPTEREWEHAARHHGFPLPAANLLDIGVLHPRAAGGATGIEQMAGDVWEWTSNHYEPYPGYKPFEGSLMEYNGKFMDNQRVLRGGSCATPRSHIRISYRNFWPGDTRFQFTGIRLVRGTSQL